MKSIMILALILSAPQAMAVTREDCESQGKAFVDALITRAGTFRKPHCRGKAVKLSDAERAERVTIAKAKHPGVRVSGQN